MFDVHAVPSTSTVRPKGALYTRTTVPVGANWATACRAWSMVTFNSGSVPATLPAQLVNTQPLAATASAVTTVPRSYHAPPAGVTAPAAATGSTAVVHSSCVAKAAVSVVPSTSAVTLWACAPPSDQALNTNCVPVPPACGLATPMACMLFVFHVIARGAGAVAASDSTARPSGAVCRV